VSTFCFQYVAFLVGRLAGYPLNNWRDQIWCYVVNSRD